LSTGTNVPHRGAGRLIVAVGVGGLGSSGLTPLADGRAVAEAAGVTTTTHDQAPDRAIAEAQPPIFTMIDDALLRVRGRSLVSGVELVDLLLDLRSTVALELELERVRASVPG
jgi:hypothetical protein